MLKSLRCSSLTRWKAFNASALCKINWNLLKYMYESKRSQILVERSLKHVIQVAQKKERHTRTNRLLCTNTRAPSFISSALYTQQHKQYSITHIFSMFFCDFWLGFLCGCCFATFVDVFAFFGNFLIFFSFFTLFFSSSTAIGINFCRFLQLFFLFLYAARCVFTLESHTNFMQKFKQSIKHWIHWKFTQLIHLNRVYVCLRQNDVSTLMHVRLKQEIKMRLRTAFLIDMKCL